MTCASVQPLRDYIAVRPDESLSAIVHVAARNAQRASREHIAHCGLVLAVGPGDYPILDQRTGRRSKVFQAMAVRPGDRVRFGEWSYPIVDTRDGPVWLIQQGDVIGVIEPQMVAAAEVVQ